MLRLGTEGSAATILRRISFSKTKVTFSSANTEFTGELTEPENLVNTSASLVAIVQESEVEPAIGSSRSLLFTPMGIRVFVHDKRGTGQSGGLYTQGFELLADDAIATMQSAREIAKECFHRAGYFHQG